MPLSYSLMWNNLFNFYIGSTRLSYTDPRQNLKPVVWIQHRGTWEIVTWYLIACFGEMTNVTTRPTLRPHYIRSCRPRVSSSSSTDGMPLTILSAHAIRNDYETTMTTAYRLVALLPRRCMWARARVCVINYDTRESVLCSRATYDFLIRTTTLVNSLWCMWQV